MRKVDGVPRILLVSLGSIGQRHLRNTRQLLPESRIAVLRHYTKSTELPDLADEIFTSIDQAKSFNPDIVIISSPAAAHVFDARVFMEQGCHVFIEKPLSANLEDVHILQNEAKNTSIFSMVGYVLRFHPALNFINRYLQEGHLGDVWTSTVQVGQYLPDWRPSADYRKGVSGQKALGGGALLELSHEIDYSTWIFGFPESLYCSSSRVSHLEIDVEDNAHVIFEYPDSRRVVIQMDFLQRTPRMNFFIVGSEGTLEADLINESITLYQPNDNVGKPLDFLKSKDGNEIYLRQFDYFFHKTIDSKHYTPVFKETASVEDKDIATIASSADILNIVEQSKNSNDQGKRLPFKRVTG